MKPQELGAALKGLAESHARKRSFGDSDDKPVSELDFSWKHGMIGLDKEGARKVTELAEKLLQQRPNVAELCTPETVRSELVEVVKRFVYSETPLDPSAEAKELIEKLSGKPCDFVFVFPVKGGRVETTMKLNRIVLVPSLEMVSTALTSGFPQLVKTPAKDIEAMIRSNETKTNAPVVAPDWFVISGSLALDGRKAEEKALYFAEEDLGLLRFRMLKGSSYPANTASIEVMRELLCRNPR